MTAAIQSTAAAERRDDIKATLTEMIVAKEKILVLITEARDSDDHLALGYRSWTDYVAADFAGLLSDLTRDDRRFAAFALAQTGMSTRAIASIMGITHTQVRRDLQVERDVPPATPAGDPDDLHEAVAGLRTVMTDHPMAAPTVVGVDGRSYPRAVRAKSSRRRRPLPDAYRLAVYDLEKAVARLERLHEDDRFPSNRDALARSRPALHRCRATLGRMIVKLGGDPTLPLDGAS